VWTSVHTPLGACLDPGPAGCAAALTVPGGALEQARRRQLVEVSLGTRHLSGTTVARDLERISGVLALHTIRPRTRQLPVLMTMLLAGFHLLPISQ
jgi:uncharacterized protein (DUF1786 family)